MTNTLRDELGFEILRSKHEGKKVERTWNKDGKTEVAVLVSPGFGAGWSTWTSGNLDMLYSPEIVALVLRKASADEIEAKANELWPDDGYFGGADQLMVVWLPKGTVFRVVEYDGNERIEKLEDETWNVA